MFNPRTLDHHVNNYASTGFNSTLIPKQDKEYHATSRRFGCETQLRTASEIHPLDLTTTTTRNSYLSPHSKPSPVWRTRETGSLFEDSQLLKMKELQSDKLASGYSANSQHWDGTYWRTEKNLHSDQERTLYRMKFDQPKPFHKPALFNNDGRLKVPQAVYDVSDK